MANTPRSTKNAPQSAEAWRARKDYGGDSPLDGAIGFVSKSDLSSDLTRKTRTPTK